MLKKFLIGTFAVAAFALVFATASAAFDFGPTTLKVGSKGTYVMNLQTALGATVDGSFGPMTKAKVVAFQASKGLAADGIVGPATKNALNAGTYSGVTYAPGCSAGTLFSSTTGLACTTVTTGLPAGCTSTAGFSSTTGAKCDGTTTDGTDNGPLVGTAGEISDVNKLSEYSSEEVGSGQSDVKVLGFDVKATKDGDIALKSTKVSFVLSNGSGSTKLADYASKVSIWMGSKKIATVDAVDFTKDSTGNYSKTISLDSSAVVRADKTVKFYVSLDSQNLDSGDIDSETVTMGINNIRYMDGSGVVTTEDTTGDLPISLVAISFVDFSTAADTELKISENNNPESAVNVVSTTKNTDGVALLKGKMKLEGTSDVWLDSVPVLFTVTGAANVDDVTPTVYLTIDGNKFSQSMTSTAGSTETIVFDNLDLTLNAGDTVDFSVSADINDIEAGPFDEGDTLKADFGETETDLATFVAENEQSDSLADSEKTGSVAGNAQAFRSTGIELTYVSSTAVKTAGDPGATVPTSDEGSFAITFKVKAIGSDVYLDLTAPDETGTGTALISDGGAGTLAATITSANTLTGTNGYKIAQDTTETFTIDAHTLATTSGYFKLSITNLKYALTDISGDVTYNFNMDDFKTSQLYLTDR